MSRQSPTARVVQSEVQISRRWQGASKTLHGAPFRRATVDDGVAGYVVTFDDITALQSAQRKAAWADVARRIAHEIKNPLTPIQLSAERLKRKYQGRLPDDSGLFAQCTDTIIRHVGDIGQMVDEFSAFARMPAPVLRRPICPLSSAKPSMLQRAAFPQIAFAIELPPAARAASAATPARWGRR